MGRSTQTTRWRIINNVALATTENRDSDPTGITRRDSISQAEASRQQSSGLGARRRTSEEFASSISDPVGASRSIR